MGKLHMEPDDISRLSAVFSDKLQIEEGALKVNLGEGELVLRDLVSTGHYEQKGVRFQIKASYSASGLSVDFE